jgi:hypothetical protein
MMNPDPGDRLCSPIQISATIQMAQENFSAIGYFFSTSTNSVFKSVP